MHSPTAPISRWSDEVLISVRAELVEAGATLRQAQGERFMHSKAGSIKASHRSNASRRARICQNRQFSRFNPPQPQNKLFSGIFLACSPIDSGASSYQNHTGQIHYASAGGMVFALFVQRTGNLGSLDSITGQSTDRGYTMHEHLDEMGVIHMNGRIYDPLVGRFMSADPFIQSPDDLQSYNRFIYVMNNPLAFTDPSGYFSLGGFLRAGLNYLVAPTIQNSFQFFAAQPGQKQVDQFVMSNPTAYAVGKIATSAFTTFCGGCGGAIYSAYYAYQGTGSVTEAAKAGAITYGTAAAFNWAGGQGEAGSPERYAAHAGVGCLSAVASGASCGAGAASAVFGKFATNNIKFGGDVANGVAAAVAGGVGSVIAGGKFENGAVTAAFGYLFNYLGALTRGAQLIQQTWGRFQSLVGSPLGQVLTEVAASEVNSGSIVGKSYGQLGRVVESFSGEMQGISNIHFVDRAIERGVSPTQILDTLRVPQVVLEQRGGGHIFITNEAAVVLNKSNQLVTTYGKAEFQKDVRSVLNEKLLLQIPK